MNKIVLQTSVNKPHQHILDRIAFYSPGWDYVHFTDQEILEYFDSFPLDEFPNVKEKFLSIKAETHKADLFRYYYLYINGGIFIDSDLAIKRNLDILIDNKQFMSVKREATSTIFNGLLYADKESIIIYDCLKHIYEIDTDILEKNYYEVCQHLYRILNSYSELVDMVIYDEPSVDCHPSIMVDKDLKTIAIHYHQAKVIPEKDLENEILAKRIKFALKTKAPVAKIFKRIGSYEDGGYVIVDDFSKNDFLISMGVANNIDFEKQLEDTFSGIHLYDGSVDSLPEELKNSVFFKEMIGSNSHHIFDRIDPDKDIILKIDIEGGEWDFFESLTTEQMNRFKQIAVEIHWMVESSHLTFKDCPIHVLEKINETHQIVARHPNNHSSVVEIDGVRVPQVIELTLLRKLDHVFIDKTTEVDFLFMKNNFEREEITNYL